MEREFSAGGVVIRRFRGRPFVAVIRSKGGTVIGLPKGHPVEGETAAQAAAREVREETGIEATVVERLGDVKYWYVRRGGPRVLKLVAFYLFRYRSGSVLDHDDEVDSAEWMPLADAALTLSYKGERDMAAAALTRLEQAR